MSKNIRSNLVLAISLLLAAGVNPVSGGTGGGALDEGGIDGLLLADYRNSYSTPYGNTYSSRFGDQYIHFRQSPNRNPPHYQPYNPMINQPVNQQYSSVGGGSPNTDGRSPESYQNQTDNPVDEAPESKDESGPVAVSGDGKTIKMEVSHSDYLPSLPEHLRKGKYFNGWSNTGMAKSKRKTDIEKFLIPEWLAGKWKRSKTTETKRVELPDGKKLATTGTTTAIIEEAFGTYRDPEGRIWQVFDPKRATGSIDRGSAIDHHRVMKYNIEVLDPKTVVVEVTASHLVVSKDKNQIVQSFQDEELNTYTLVDNRKAKTESSVKVFDQLGKPVLLTHSYSFVSKVQSAK